MDASLLDISWYKMVHGQRISLRMIDKLIQEVVLRLNFADRPVHHLEINSRLKSLMGDVIFGIPIIYYDGEPANRIRAVSDFDNYTQMCSDVTFTNDMLYSHL
jgi:hypothetical protein